jgi:uncharacterized protein YerC
MEKEIEVNKKKLKENSKDLSLMGEKVVTFENLKLIYKQLTEMSKINEIKVELQNLNDKLGEKETEID